MGLVVVGLLAPIATVDTLPQQCFSIIGLGAPCDAGLAAPVAAAAAGLVGMLVCGRSRRRSRPDG